MRFFKPSHYLRNYQFMSLAGNVAVSGLGVVSVSLLFRALPMIEVGQWIFFLSTVGLADAFRTGFLTTAFIRACSGATPARAAEVIGSAWLLALVITGAMVALNVLAWLVLTLLGGRLGLSIHLTGELVLLLRWFGVALVATLPFYIATNVLQAELRFDKIMYIRLMSQGIFVLGVIGMMLTRTARLEYVVYCYLAASAGTSVATLLLGWARLGSLRHRTGTCIRELAHFGKFSFGSYVGTSLLGISDTYFMNFMLGPAQLAVYSVAARFFEIINIPLRSFTATAMSTLSAAYNQGRLGEVARLLRKNAGMLTWAFVPVIIGTILLADIPVILIGGDKYRHTEAANVLRLLMCLSILFPVDRFAGLALDVVNQPRINLIKVFLMLGVNILGDLFVYWAYPTIYGITLASFPPALAGLLFGYWHVRKHLPLSLRSILATGFWEIRALIWRFLGWPVTLHPSQLPHD